MFATNGNDFVIMKTFCGSVDSTFKMQMWDHECHSKFLLLVFCSLSFSLSLHLIAYPLTLSLCHSLSLSLSLSHTHTLTHTQSLSFSLSHTHSLSLPLSHLRLCLGFLSSLLYGTKLAFMTSASSRPQNALPANNIK